MQYVEAGVTVRLGDQFDNQPDEVPGPKRGLVLKPVRFCGPVRMTVEATGAVTPITKPNSFLTFYELFELQNRRLTPTRKVVVENQFGKKTLTVYQPELLGVPTQVLGDGPEELPTDLNHFKCYRAFGPNAKKLVTLQDRYLTATGVKVGLPFSFCNPTEKNHDEVITPVVNPADHLVCYFVTRTPSATEGVETFDQFQRGLVAKEGQDLLCVPTKKFKATVVR